MDEFQNVLVQHLAGFVPADLLERRADVGNHVTAIDDDHQIRGVLAQRAKALLAFHQRRFHLALYVARVFEPQGSCHCQPQARQAVLVQKVARPQFDQARGLLVADDARHHDERNIEASLIEQLQCAQPGKLREPVIGKDYIGGRVQAGKISRLGLYTVRLRGKPVVTQGAQHPLGVMRRVLDNEHANWICQSRRSRMGG